MSKISDGISMTGLCLIHNSISKKLQSKTGILESVMSKVLIKL